MGADRHLYLQQESPGLGGGLKKTTVIQRKPVGLPAGRHLYLQQDYTFIFDHFLVAIFHILPLIPHIFHIFAIFHIFCLYFCH